MLALGATVALSGCSGSITDENRGAATSTRAEPTPSSTSSAPPPSSGPTDVPLHLAQRWRDHPEEQPFDLRTASVLVDELTQATVVLPAGVTYHLTIYGTPPPLGDSPAPDPSGS